MTSQPNHSSVSLQSTTTLTSSSPQGHPKDYEAAFSALQSRYGTGGHLPNPKDKPSKKLPGSSEPSTSASAIQAIEVTQAAPNPVVTTPDITPGSSQTTLSPSSVILEPSGGSSSINSAGQARQRSKGKNSILKSLFKGRKSKSD